MPQWSPKDSESLYNVPNWGQGFFSINDSGNVCVTPGGTRGGARIDLYELIDTILQRGVAAPILLRFDGILRARVRQMRSAFDKARAEFGYEAPFRGVYPIKVNQERTVVEALLAEGRPHGMGLEVGSKPELLAGIALQAGEGALLICNGYKDEEYVEMALLSSQLGITPIIVVEKFTELETVMRAAARLGVRPTIGVRSKLAVKGSGRWQNSVGDRSKFGLTTREIVMVVERLRDSGRLDCLKLLHFHIGSQITDIRALKQAMREGTNTLIGLSRMGVRIEWFDVGGGLGVDYDGSSTNIDSSMNYTMEEYARDVVWHLGEACREADIAEPTIVTESGRALVSHHAVLVGEVVGVSHFDSRGSPAPPRDDEPEVVLKLAELLGQVTAENHQECYHDANELREEAMLLFNTSRLGLPDRARIEDLYFRTCEKILRITREMDYVPEELEHLERDLSDTYFVNFSIFQSMPDSWAIRQMFPVMPLHRHREEPVRRGVLADLTCDSDGKIEQFIDLRNSKSTLELHPFQEDAPYYLGFFLIGAYQEILGDMHNLFGDTNIVHVDVDESGRPKLTHVLRGDRVKEVLSYVRYFEGDVLRDLRRHVEAALDKGTMTYEESAAFLRRYEAALNGYTYLTRQREIQNRPLMETRVEDPAELQG